MTLIKSAVRNTAAASAAILALGLGGEAWSDEPIAAQPLTDRHAFTDEVAAQITLRPEGLDEIVVELDDVSRIAVVEIVAQPGAAFPWHTHPAPVLVSIVEGELTYVWAEDCVELAYPAGTAFVDPGGDNVHTAFNSAGGEVTRGIAVFLGAPEEGALTQPIDEADSNALDEECGVDRAEIAHGD